MMAMITKEQFKKLRSLHRRIYDALPDHDAADVMTAAEIAEKIGEPEKDVRNALQNGCRYAFGISRSHATAPPIDVYYCKGADSAQ